MSELEEAARRVLAGDRAAFRAIVEATSERLVRLSARMLGNVTEAEDVVQEAYVKAFQSLCAGQFDGRSKIETWLYRIVVNGTIDAKRRLARVKPSQSGDVAESGGAAEPSWNGADAAHAHVALKELAGWLDALPDEQRVVLLMKAMEGMSSAEIAAILETSEGAIEQRLVRARATLREKTKGGG